MLPKFKKNEMVAVCYDGKWTRAVEALVLDVGLKNDWVKLRFKPWANEEAGFVEMVAQTDHGSFAGYLTGEGENGVMRMLGGNGDWYRVQTLEELKKFDYSVALYDRPTPIGVE